MAAKTHSTPELPMGKVVRYNKENGDFDFFFNREYLGSRAERRDAEECLNEYVYDFERGYITPAALGGEPIPFPETVTVVAAPAEEEDDDEAISPEEWAAIDAANHAKVASFIEQAFTNKTVADLFVDTLPGHINGTPIDLLVCFSIGAAIERDKAALGITQEQVYGILHHISEVCGQYLETPLRKMQLMWDGM